MVTDASPTYEDRFIEAIGMHLGTCGSVDKVFLRHMEKTDPSRSAAICLEEWTADEWEMTGDDCESATVATYVFNIEYFVKADNRTNGQQLVRKGTKDIRLMLERGMDLRVALRQLTDAGEDGRTERILRMPRVSGHRYGDALIEGAFNHLSVTTFTIVTETI